MSVPFSPGRHLTWVRPSSTCVLEDALDPVQDVCVAAQLDYETDVCLRVQKIDRRERERERWSGVWFDDHAPHDPNESHHRRARGEGHHYCPFSLISSRSPRLNAAGLLQFRYPSNSTEAR